MSEKDQVLIRAVKSFEGDGPIVNEEKVKEVRQLLSGPADPNFCDEEGLRAIDYAVTEAPVVVVRMLLDAGADIFSLSANGFSALENALWKSPKDVRGNFLMKATSLRRISPDGKSPTE